MGATMRAKTGEQFEIRAIRPRECVCRRCINDSLQIGPRMSAHPMTGLSIKRFVPQRSGAGRLA